MFATVVKEQLWCPLSSKIFFLLKTTLILESLNLFTMLKYGLFCESFFTHNGVTNFFIK